MIVRSCRRSVCLYREFHLDMHCRGRARRIRKFESGAMLKTAAQHDAQRADTLPSDVCTPAHMLCFALAVKPRDSFGELLYQSEKYNNIIIYNII